MGPSVEALENQYFLLRGSLSTLTGQGAMPEQLKALREQIATSRNNYWTATRSILHDDDPRVEALVSQMNTQQISLEATIKHLGDMSKVLDAITKAVAVGSKLAALAVPL